MYYNLLNNFNDSNSNILNKKQKYFFYPSQIHNFFFVFKSSFLLKRRNLFALLLKYTSYIL